jgi:hypothetical protein
MLEAHQLFVAIPAARHRSISAVGAVIDGKIA